MRPAMTDRMAALRMERQFLLRRANREEYSRLYRDTSPGQSVYWHGFGDPPSLTLRAGFDDMEYNRQRQKSRALVKGRFLGGNLGWVCREDLELFAGLGKKPLASPGERQALLLGLLRHEGPMSIQMMKEWTGLLVKEITPALHRLQEAFLVYEDQYDGEWDRAWYLFEEMFPDADTGKYTRHQALCEVLPRFAYRNAAITAGMAKSFYRLPAREIKAALAELAEKGILAPAGEMLCLAADAALLEAPGPEVPRSVFVLHRNDFLVKSNEDELKERFPPGGHETLQYLLIDGRLRGAVAGKFKYGPYILEDVLLDMPEDEKQLRRDEIIDAIYATNGRAEALKRYDGKEL